MVRLLVVNPNSTASMTAKIGRAAEEVAAPATLIEAWTSGKGPPSIQGPEDGAAALPGLFEEIRKGSNLGFDALIIACFDDTGLYEARRLTKRPVIGIGEAAFHAAMLIAERFTVITTLSVSVPIIEENLVRYGISRKCARVRACEVPVLDLEDPASGAAGRISAEIKEAIQADGCDAIVLGCAGMADLANELGRSHDIPVIDGVAAAVKMAEALVSLGFETSQRGPFRLMA
jgi:allantoin racemase